MPNPAQLLHELFSEWRNSRDGSTHEFMVRGLGADHPDRAENFARHQRAMHHLTQLEQIFAALEDEGKHVANLKAALPRWRAHILHYPHPWGGIVGNDNTELPSEESLSILATAGLMIEVQYQSMEKSTREDLAEIISEAREMLLGSNDLPADLKRHLHTLLSEADYCLQHFNECGEFDLREATDGLVGAMHAAFAHTQDDDLRDWIKSAIHNLVTPYISGTAAAITAAQMMVPPEALGG